MLAKTPIKELTSKLPALLTYAAHTSSLSTSITVQSQKLKLQTTTLSSPGMASSYRSPRIANLHCLSINHVLNRAGSLTGVQSANPVELSQPGLTAPKARSISGTNCGVYK